MKESKGSTLFEFVYLLSEVIVIILFATCAKYDEGVHPKTMTNPVAVGAAGAAVSTYYSVFIDVHVMIFIGFGFLMVFLKSHSWASVGLNYVIAAYAVQVSILAHFFWK